MYLHRALARARIRLSFAALVTSVVVGLALLWSPPAAFADGVDLLSNPGCESGTSGFSGYSATVAADTAVKHSGAASCRVTSTGGSFYSLQSAQSSTNPTQGRTFTASAWVRTASTTGHNVFVALRERGGSAADRTVYGTGVAPSTTWQRITASITVASAGRAALDFYVTEDPGSTGQVFYADDMTFQLDPISPSGGAMPVGDLPGWHQIRTEDFAVNAATGTWRASCSDPGGYQTAASKVVYTGATGTGWHTYPDCANDTSGRPYRSDQVLSVHDGVLDFTLHDVAGQPAGASPSPVLDTASNSVYQTYGRYSYRFRTDTTHLPEYKVAWLLWPQTENNWPCAESDFPEAGLSDTTVRAFAHYGCSTAQDQFPANIDLTQWHTFTQEWSPGTRRYYLDGALIGTSTHSVYAGPERLQLQTEATGSGTDVGHLLVDWVVVYAYAP